MATERTTVTRVLVVDPRRTFAEAIAAAISAEPDMAGRAVTSGSEAQRAVGEGVDMLLLNVLADDDVPGSVGRLLEGAPELRVLLVADEDDDRSRARTRRAGAQGLLTTCEPIERVIDAIRAVMNSEPMDARVERDAWPGGLDGKRRRQPHATEYQRSDRLSPREREILQLMADGSEPPQIAAQLGIAPATLRTHVQNILTKLRVHSKTQAVLMAIRQGTVTGRR